MTTTYTNSSDTSFSLKWITNAHASTVELQSSCVKHCGLEWFISAIGSDGALKIYLECNGNDSNGWRANVKNTVKLWKNNGTHWTQSAIRDLDCEKKYMGFAPYKQLSELEPNGYIKDGKITIESIVEIQTIYGNHPERKHDFKDEKSKFSDVKLMVEGKPLYASKHMLACYSPVFHSKFYIEFEKQSVDTLELPNAKFDEVEKFLQLMYHCDVEIKTTNVNFLLRLAHRYKTRMITDQCESFLISTNRYKINDKLSFAEAFSLARLKAKCMAEIETTAKLEEACVGMEKKAKKTILELITKAMVLMDKKGV